MRTNSCSTMLLEREMRSSLIIRRPMTTIPASMPLDLAPQQPPILPPQAPPLFSLEEEEDVMMREEEDEATDSEALVLQN